MLDRIFVRKKIEEFLLEDIGYQDITTDNLHTDREVEALIVSKEDGIIAGIDVSLTVFEVIDSSIKIKKLKNDGETIKKGEEIAVIRGSGKSILKGERVMLNILQRMSGIATNTKRFSEKIEDTKAKILDTRKTTPGFRAFEKYAVRIGGGKNHRFALYDMVMIKDNHISLAGGIKEAVNQIKKNVSPMVKIEVEVSSLEELKETLELDVDIVMLDNMGVEEVKEAVRLNSGRKLIEVSGNITLNNIREYAETGVDFISSGAVIHSAKWLDISLKFI
ncbi:nicotinate-nucleotide pyrophosphorylase [carboxylating] [Persephonella hydrogeniphila]|uniref:Probable nicotinate-nucleotide pyrophosphorylase [carboxylating] n=1 Tax=Persephonella hydrogeniphila TaxID=198703 RepID=A0A285NL60_9AQUI|nr:carboxylating nicotinate-nucleotide diphosphorylase [Persephonella hydrogeniphila]SNZ10195.1 nicotinate-nucleotide pyrophosphorylase [carboxylating] [Persephonella hydrogeniphila]